jgi:hypothetical protein
MASINYLERCAVKLYKERADKLIKRRQDDVKDQSMEYLPGYYIFGCFLIIVSLYFTLHSCRHWHLLKIVKLCIKSRLCKSRVW